MICLRFKVNDSRLNSRVNSLPLRPRTISFEGIKSWVNSVHIGSDTSCSFFPLLLYSACIYSSLFFSTRFFSFTFSILLILSLSLLYSFHVVSLSAIAWSLTVIVDIGSLLRELNLELILFILALILPALSSLFFSTLLLFIFPSSFQLFCFSFTFSFLLILSLSLLYSFHVASLSAIAWSLAVIVDIGSLLRELNLELILFLLTLLPPALSVGMGSLEKELNLELILFLLALIPPALSSLYFSTLLVFIFPSSFQLFCFSSTFSFLLILSLSVLYSFHVVSLSAIAWSLTVIVDIGSLEKDIKSWVNSVHIGSDTSCSFSWYRISWEGIKCWANSVLIGSDTSCSFFLLLPSSACIDFSLFFSTLLFLLYLLLPSDSFPFSSLLFSCSLFKCNCLKFNCNSWYRISFEGIKSWVNSVLIDSATSCSFTWYGISWEGIKSWVNSVLIDSATSCSFSWDGISWEGIKSNGYFFLIIISNHQYCEFFGWQFVWWFLPHRTMSPFWLLWYYLAASDIALTASDRLVYRPHFKKKDTSQKSQRW